MTATLKFVRDTVTVSLQMGSQTTGLQLLEGWQPKIGDGAEPVTETLPVLAIGTSHNDLAARLQALHDMQIWADEYRTNFDERRPVWLHAKLVGETNERRALVYRIEATFKSSWFDAESAVYMQELILVVDRGPWEAIGVVVGATLTDATGAVVQYDYTTSPGMDVSGDIPARVDEFRVSTKQNGATLEYDRFWIGLRSERRHGLLMYFRPLWEAETGTLENGASLISDSTASPGSGNTAVRVSGTSTETLARRVARYMYQFTGNYAENYGRFLVLLRARVGGGAWNVQMRYAYKSGATLLTGPLVRVAKTVWDIYEMGIVDIPLRDAQAIPAGITGYPVPSGVDLYFASDIWAERVSGSANLDLDCTIHIPVDEGFCIAKGARCDFSLSGQRASLVIGTAPTGRIAALGLAPVSGGSQTVTSIPQLSARDFALPVGDGRAYIVVAGTDSSDLADSVTVSARWYPRWLSLRGEEA